MQKDQTISEAARRLNTRPAVPFPPSGEDFFSLMVHKTAYQDMLVHDHNTYELLYIVSGKANVKIGTSRYQITRPTIVIISKLETHSVKVVAEPYERYYILLSDHQLRHLIPDYVDRALFTAHNLSFNHCLNVPDSQMERTKNLFAEMYEVYKGQAENRSAYLHAVFNLMLQLLISFHPDEREIRSRHVDPRIVEIQNYLDRHFTDDIPLQKLADRWYMSPNHLSQLMKKSIGYSPKQYIMQCRLSVAREMLATQGAQVSEIASACGFHDQNNFIRFFRKETGLTPGQYRQKVTGSPEVSESGSSSSGID